MIFQLSMNTETAQKQQTVADGQTQTSRPRSRQYRTVHVEVQTGRWMEVGNTHEAELKALGRKGRQDREISWLK